MTNDFLKKSKIKGTSAPVRVATSKYNKTGISRPSAANHMIPISPAAF